MSAAFSPFDAAPEPVAPTSPLSQLVQSGYQNPVAGAPESQWQGHEGMVRQDSYGAPAARQDSYGAPGARHDSYGCPPALPGSRASAQQDSYDGNSAQQWSNNQSNTANYQQQQDPNYAGSRKPSGYRVSHAPGGGSSICLGDGSSDAGSRGQRAPSPSYAGGRSRQREASPFATSATGGQREASPFAVAGRAASGQREASPFSGSRGGGHQGGGGVGAAMGGGENGRYPELDMESRYGGGSSCGGGRPPVPMPRNDARSGREMGAPCHGGGAHGARQENRSSNAYASGGNQNCGNFVTDRRTTRIAQPPGGRSQISFG